MQNAECRIGPKAVHTAPECRMQMQNADRPQSCALHPMQDADAECRMQNRPQSCALATAPDGDAGCRCRMQKLASPNVGRTVEGGPKKVVRNAQCRCGIHNPTKECRLCVQRGSVRLYGADAPLSMQTEFVLHATCLTRTRTRTLPLELFNINFVVSSQALAHERYPYQRQPPNSPHRKFERRLHV